MVDETIGSDQACFPHSFISTQLKYRIPFTISSTTDGTTPTSHLETAQARDWNDKVDVVRGVANAIPALSHAMDPPRSDRELPSTTIRSGRMRNLRSGRADQLR